MAMLGGMAGRTGAGEQNPDRDAMWKQWVTELRKIVPLVSELCGKMDLREQPFGEREEHRGFTARKGMKTKKLIFSERYIHISARRLGAWDVTMHDNRELWEQGKKPNRTMAVNQIREIRVHTLNIQTDWDNFRLTGAYAPDLLPFRVLHQNLLRSGSFVVQIQHHPRTPRLSSGCGHSYRHQRRRGEIGHSLYRRC